MGLPLGAVKNAVQRDGKDASVMDLDPNKSIKSQMGDDGDKDDGPPLKEDPEYEKVSCDVFVKFKKYNKTVEKDAQDTKQKTRKDSIKRRRYRISAERSNRFTHKGRIADYVDPTIPKSEPAKSLSFADFKTEQVYVG